MKEVVSVGARFLKKNTGSHEWHVAEIKVGKDKISHCLREIKNRRSPHAWAQYRSDSPPTGNERLTTAHQTGQLLHEAQQPQEPRSDRPQCEAQDPQQWSLGANGRDETVHSVSPFTLSPSSSMLLDLQPKETSEQGLKPVTVEGSSAALMNSLPASSSVGESYVAGRQAHHTSYAVQNQLLVDYANTFSKKHYHHQQIHRGGAQKNLYCHPEPDEKEEAVPHRSSRKEPSWTQQQHSSLDMTTAPPCPAADQPATTYAHWPPIMHQRGIDQQPLPSSDDGLWSISTLPSNEENLSHIFSDSESLLAEEFSASPKQHQYECHTYSRAA